MSALHFHLQFLFPISLFFRIFVRLILDDGFIVTISDTDA